MNRTLFSDVMIFDGSGSGLFPGSVLIEGSRPWPVLLVYRGGDD